MKKHFTIIIPSYNMENYIERCLLSCITQNYDKNYFEIIIRDDCSTDNTWKIINNLVSEYGEMVNITCFKNKNRIYGLANINQMIRNDVKYDYTIILQVDGDDSLSNSSVLQKLNHVFQDDNVWITYGNNISSDGSKHCHKLPDEVIKQNAYRKYIWGMHHPRAMYKWLFDKIKEEDFKDENCEWLKYTTDKAIIFPALEMANGKFKFIEDILYNYNASSDCNVHKTNNKEQNTAFLCIINKKPYEPILNKEDNNELL